MMAAPVAKRNWWTSPTATWIQFVLFVALLVWGIRYAVAGARKAAEERAELEALTPAPLP